MARQKSAPPASTDLTPAMKQSLADDSARHGELMAKTSRELEEIDRRFGMGRPYDLHACISIAREAAHSFKERLFVIGNMCTLIKEHEQKGMYEQALLDIGIDPAFARKCRAVVAKFGGTDAKKEIAERLDGTKLIALLTESDERIEALIDGGTVRNLSLDDIDRMSVSEVRAALRKEREERQHEAEAHEDIVSRKDKKIAQLDLKARRLNKAPFREKLDAFLQEFNEVALAAQGALDNLRFAMTKMDEMHHEAGESYSAHVLEVIDGHARSVMALANDITELAKA